MQLSLQTESETVMQLFVSESAYKLQIIVNNCLHNYCERSYRSEQPFAQISVGCQKFHDLELGNSETPISQPDFQVGIFTLLDFNRHLTDGGSDTERWALHAAFCEVQSVK